MEKKYIPISCDFYDEIELLALRKSKCKVIYRDEEDKEQIIEGIINDVFSKNKIEYLIVNEVTKIRLDRLISINDKLLPGVC